MYCYADKKGYTYKCTDDVKCALENAYRKKLEKSTWVDNAGNTHQVNFKKQTDQVNGTKTKIKRRLVFGKYKFPHSAPENVIMEKH